MRHNKKFNHLGRKKVIARRFFQPCDLSYHFPLENLHDSVKAKAIEVYAEPLITGRRPMI